MVSATSATTRPLPATRSIGSVALGPAMLPCAPGWRARCLHGPGSSETNRRAPRAVQAGAQLRSPGLPAGLGLEHAGLLRRKVDCQSRLVARAKPDNEPKSTGPSKEEDQPERTVKAAKEPLPRPQPDDDPKDNQNPLSRLLAMVWARVAALGGGALGLVRSRGVAAFLTFGALLGAMALAATLGNSHRASQAAKAPKEVLYSEFLTMVKSQGVQNAVVDDSGNRVYFSLRPHSSEVSATAVPTDAAAPVPVAGSSADLRKGAYQFYTQPVKNTAIAAELMDAGVDFGAMKSSIGSAISKVLVTMLIVWIPMLPLIILLRRTMDSRSGSGGRKRSKKSGGPGAPTTTFADVAGVDTAKEELMEVVSCLKDNTKYAKLNAKMPSGVLLSGPPGTGKTLLAKAVAGEAGVPFFAASASEFVELFVGRGAARVRELFAEARKRSPCVVFIDELDAVGMKRGFGNNEERDQTLNQLLTELDGFEGREGVLLLAATNRPESLDPALLRPGRLSRKVVVPLPDEYGRANILAIHMRDVPFDESADKNDAIMKTARIAGGFSGAELANVVNEAAMLAARKDAEYITLRELIEGVSRTRYGVDGRRPREGSLGARVQNWFLDSAASQNQPSGSGQQVTG